MTATVRENDYKLQGRFGKASWKVALEPERRTTVCCLATSIDVAADTTVSVHALSPLTDKILIGITE